METLTAKRYSFGDFELDASRRRLFRDGEALALKSRTFDLLLALVERKGEVLSKDELLETVWAGQFVEEGNLTVHISALRKILGEKKDDHHFIVTVPGRGYSFVADLYETSDDDLVYESHTVQQIVVEEEISDEDDQPRQIVPSLPAKPATVRPFGHYLFAFAGATALVALLGAGGYLFLNRSSATGAVLPPQQMSIKRLTNKGTVSRAAISPDGKLFAFSIPEGDKESLWLGHVDGGEPVQIRPAAGQLFLFLKFTPDGSSIYYTTGENYGNGILYKMPVFGGTPERVQGDFRSLAFSPDGKQIAFLRWDEQRQMLVINAADTDGANGREVTALPAELGTNWYSPTWSPDGSTIALIRGVKMDDAELYAVNIKDGSTRQFSKKVWRSLDAITWLHDGSGIIATGTEKDTSLRQLWFAAFPSGEVRRLTNDLTDWGFLASIANDNSLVVVQGISQSNIWVAPANILSESKQVTFGSTGRQDGWNGLVWTADGRIVYAANTKDGSTLSVMNADGSASKQLIPNGGDSSYPSLTADGRTIVFQSNRGGHYSVWRADMDGGNLTQLTGDQTAGQPFVSPDGKWIIYNSHIDSEGELWRIPTAGGEPQRVTDRPAAWAQISPDSKSIACDINIDDRTKLGILTLETGEITKTFDMPRLANLRLGVHWTPDGRAVTYRDWANGIWRQNIDGGEPQRLNGLPEEKVFCYGWSPDGRYFAFTRGNTTRDAALITGLGPF